MCFCVKGAHGSQTLHSSFKAMMTNQATAVAETAGSPDVSVWTWNCFDWVAEPFLEHVGKLYGDVRLSRSGVYLQRLCKCSCFHHTGLASLRAVEHPDGQGEAGISVRLLNNRWKFGWDADGLRHVHDVTGNHLTVQQPLVTCKAGNTVR